MHSHKSADFVPFVCFLGTPLPPPGSDVIYGSPLSALIRLQFYRGRKISAPSGLLYDIHKIGPDTLRLKETLSFWTDLILICPPNAILHVHFIYSKGLQTPSLHTHTHTHLHKSCPIDGITEFLIQRSLVR